MGDIKRPEILAPAGSMESLKAAVAAGCDAVYIGGSRFGARAYADNPQGDEMTDAIRYCHLHGVKIYMTVNTLLKERELRQELYEYIRPYYLEGLDAVIVQDVGVMRFLHGHFPDLELHASTQMTLTMGKSTRLLEQYGVSRIVPARELTLPELVQMRRDTGLEMEVFVHGALCYCYSGQCLFSSMLGGRSGNRGRCAQPCRMPYQIIDGLENGQTEEKKHYSYILSPKENCNLGYIGELIEAGVDSFKIEGRMKRPEYTAFTTAMYRKYVDLYKELGKEGYGEYLQMHQKQWQEDIRKLGELYNRSGFTSGYLEGKAGVPYGDRQGKGEMLSSLRPKHGGIRVGRVLAVDRHTVTYELERDLHPQDVVEFRDNRQRPVYEYTLGEEKRAGNRITARYQKGCRILPGNPVYRTKDADLLEEIREIYIQREKKEALQAIFHGKERENMTLELVCRCKDGQEIRIQAEGAECQKAQKQPATVEGIKKLLCQTGDTPFVIEDCQVCLEGELFLPVGAVKKLRRQALDQIQHKLEKIGSRKAVSQEVPVQAWSGKKTEEQQPSWKEQEAAVCIAAVLNTEQFHAAVSSEHVDTIYLKMDQMTDRQLKEAICQGESAGKKMYLMLPAIFRSAVYDAEKRKLSDSGNLYRMSQLAGFVIRNMESFVFLRDEVEVEPSRIITDSNLYIANGEALAYWQEQGCSKMTLPLELTEKEIRELSGREKMEAVVYSHIPLMVSAQCVLYNMQGCRKDTAVPSKSFLTLQDGKGRQFLVFNVCKYCYNVIYQEQPLVLEKEKTIYLEQGICRFRYDFSVESKEQVGKILAGKLPAGQTGHFYTGME